MNILITSASRKVGLVKSFKNALLNEGGGCVITVDSSPFAAAMYRSDFSYIVPKSSEDSFIPAIEDICREHNIKLIIPTRDEELPLFSKYKSKFKMAGITVMVSEYEAINRCQDKARFIKFCKQNMFNIPRTYTVEEAIDGSVPYPLFIKSRFGKSSKNTFVINSGQELKFIVGFVREPIIQEYIDVNEYTIDAFTDFNGNIISAVPRERIYTFGGESFVSKTIKNDILQNEAVRLVKSLRLIGHNTIQCFFDGKNVKFIEVNPRYGGGASLSIAAGADTPLYLVQLLNGKHVDSHIDDFKDGYVMMRYIEDIFMDEDTINGVKRFDKNCNI